ncbi:YveK family protein [Alkalicoccus daliensis]|uniref:YveK family protein n=1 Tax=Alkalicoccus daliensis TaxID=745820 RepID=UPI001586DD6E|nr:hypothetical protein [Alkalicoccus daliensis]
MSATKEIQLRSILTSLLRKSWVIVLFTMIIGGGGNYYFQSETADSLATVTASVLVGEGEGPKVNMKTMTALMNEPAVLEKVVEELPWETSISELNGKITTEEVEGSQIIRVTATEKTPEEAVVLANTIVEVFPEVSQEITGINTVTILSEADIKEAGIIAGEDTNMMPLFSLVAGLAAGVGAAFLLDSIDQRIRTEREIENLLEVPVLGMISKIDKYSMRSSKKKNIPELKRGEKIV